MSDLVILLALAGFALVAAWLVNVLVGYLSGEHPRDTPRVWLDMLLEELRGVSEVVSFFRPRWVRWTVAAVLGGAVFGVLYFVFHA